MPSTIQRPELNLDKMKILGIDEARRGCVIGPMAVSAVLIRNKSLKYIRKLGIKDSKKLTSKKREKLAKEIEQKVLGFQIILHQPEEIDAGNLNQLDLQSIADLINKFKPNRAFFDVPTHPNGITNFINSVQLLIKSKTELFGENKADEKYPVVSAASILAKVRRDEIIENLKKKYGDFGSGYMSDLKTQQFLKKCYQNDKSFPSIVRKKWSSVQKFLVEQQKFL